MDAGVCRDVFERRDPETPLPTSVALHRRVQQIYDREAGTLAAEGRSFAAVELSQALALIWAEPDSEARWLAGEDVFAGCRTADISVEPPPDFG